MIGAKVKSKSARYTSMSCNIKAVLNPDLTAGTLQYKVLGARRNVKGESGGAKAEAIMQKWLRRIRGAIGMGLTWAAAWGVAGMVPRWLFGFNTDVPFPIVFGALGFMAGIAFSVVLMVFEGRRNFDQMTLPRFAAWGGLSGLLL